MIASLPWYDLLELREPTDALWTAVCRRLRADGIAGVPNRLDRDTPFERQWGDSAFLFGQACGYDVVLPHRERLRVVATPHYDAPGCGPGTYRSRVVVRRRDAAGSLQDLRGRVCAINSPNSHSGWNSRNGRFFGRVVRSGSHETSLEFLRAGRADVAAIDCVTWALLERCRPRALDGLRTLAWTDEAPAPPFVTGSASGVEMLRRLREALEDSVADPALETARRALLLARIEILPLEAYYSIASLEAESVRAGYGLADMEAGWNAWHPFVRFYA